MPGSPPKGSLLFARMAEAAGAAGALFEVFDNFEAGVDHRHEHHLRDAIAGLDGEGLLAAVPAGDEELALIIRIDQAYEVAEHDAMFMAEPRARQDHRRHVAVGHVHRETRRDEVRFAGLYVQMLVETGAQIQARRAAGSVGRQRKLLTDARVEDFELDVSLHDNALRWLE